MTNAKPAGGGLLAPATYEEIDMTGVDPLRLAEIRRRVAVVKSFVALTEPTDADRASHAVELGLSVNQFLALVRAWRQHGRAAAISCAGAVKGTPRPNGARNLPAASKAAAREVIAMLESDVSLTEIMRIVKKRCGALKIATPSRSTIWNMVMAERRSRGSAGGAGLVVSRCHVKIPVKKDNDVVFPKITLTVDLATGAILAAAMDGGAATALTMASVMKPAYGPVLVDADLAAIVQTHTSVRVVPVKPTAARTATAKALGRGFGSLDLIYQRSKSIRPSDMLRSRKDGALEYEDARRIIAEHLITHNAGRGVKPPILSWVA